MPKQMAKYKKIIYKNNDVLENNLESDFFNLEETGKLESLICKCEKKG